MIKLRDILNFLLEDIQHDKDEVDFPIDNRIKRITRMKMENDTPSNVICAWCKKEIGHNPNLPPDKISHGICQDCEKKYFTNENTTSEEPPISKKVRLLVTIYERLMKDSNNKIEPAAAMQMAAKMLKVNSLNSREDRVVMDNFHSIILHKLADGKNKNEAMDPDEVDFKTDPRIQSLYQSTRQVTKPFQYKKNSEENGSSDITV